MESIVIASKNFILREAGETRKIGIRSFEHGPHTPTIDVSGGAADIDALIAELEELKDNMRRLHNWEGAWGCDWQQNDAAGD